jgi:hypothetical protein
MVASLLLRITIQTRETIPINREDPEKMRAGNQFK